VWSTQVTQLILSEAPPVLQITAAGTNALLSWPTNEIGFTLQSSPVLAPATWSPVTNAVSIAGDQNVVAVSLTQAMLFFRLAR